ncbi:MAG TPA: Ig-like domain-containing protein, partial [bacterium]|nr:Ig-like domain-containing protein [bacterium]
MNKFNKSKKIKIWVSLYAMLMFLSGVGLVYKAMAAQSITVTISSSVSSPTNLGEIPIFVDFSQNVTGFDISDISYGNATIDNFRMYSTPDGYGYGYGYGYTFNLHPQSQGASTVSIGADKATDINNNTNLASNNFSIIYDTIPPVISGVSIPTGTYKIGSVITATITADAAGYTAGAITINGVSVTNFTDATGGSYTVKYTVASGDTDRTSVSEIPISVVLTDAAGNSSEAYTNTPTGGTVTIDAHAPTNQNDVFSANTSKKGGASVNVVSANETGGSIWFAPYGTTSFISGDTMTTAGGTATSINSPATAGEYRLFVIDASGNVSSASTAVLTVDSTAPSGYTVTIDQAYINNSN